MIEWLRQASADPQITVGSRVLPIEIRRHKTAKRLTLRLAPDGSAVRITLPRWCATKEAVAFAEDRREWLARQLEKIPEKQDPITAGKVLYRGGEIAVDWREDAPRKPLLRDGRLQLGGPLECSGKRLEHWLDREAIGLITEDVSYYCDRAGLPPAQVRLSRAKRRWGSCSSKGVLRLNWRLVQAPDFVRRSVVAHEVAHLVHFDHSPAFHALLDTIYEGEIDSANRWLKQHGRTLYASFS